VQQTTDAVEKGCAERAVANLLLPLCYWFLSHCRIVPGLA